MGFRSLKCLAKSLSYLGAGPQVFVHWRGVLTDLFNSLYSNNRSLKRLSCRNYTKNKSNIKPQTSLGHCLLVSESTTCIRASLVLPLAAAAAAAAAAADFAAEAAALFSILAARFSDPELAADDRTLGRCMALSHVESFYCCKIYYVIQGGPEAFYSVWLIRGRL